MILIFPMSFEKNISLYICSKTVTYTLLHLFLPCINYKQPLAVILCCIYF